MKGFILKLFFFLVPFITIPITYIALDPFLVLSGSDKFFKTQGKACPNKGYTSTMMFDYNYKYQHYNSFIFGNSRSIFYQISDWKQHLPPASNCFHFDASEESIYALYKKIKYIDSKGLTINNALLIIDYSTLKQDKPKTGHLFVIPPQLEHYENVYPFHLEFFKAFISYKFLYAYIVGKVKLYAKTVKIRDDKPIDYDITSNEMQFRVFENLISEGKYYTEDRKKIFFRRGTKQAFSPIVIADEQKKMLQEVFEIFRKNKTNYRIVISPLYDQKKLSTQDLDYLIELFGSENVFDFSGINKFTNNYTNYYETSHYRPHIAREIMSLIYQSKEFTFVKQTNVPVK